MASFKTVRVVTGTKPPQYRAVNIVTSGSTTYPTYLQTTLDDRTFETVYNAGSPAVAGLETVIISGATPAPAVTSVSPSSGSTAGGDSITIAGTNFTDATAVKFGSTDATSFVVDSDIQITATSPAGSASTVDITVTTAGGTSPTGSADHFTFSVPAVTWNPSDKTANTTLSNGNLTAISANGSGAGARATTSHTSGKYYWEVTIDADVGGAFAVIATALTAGSSLTAADANNVEFVNSSNMSDIGQIYTAGVLEVQYSFEISSVGNVLQIAADLDNRLIWCRGNLSTLWNNINEDDPATTVGGEALPAGAIFPGIQLNAAAANAQATANFGATAFVGTRPTGFGNW